MNTTDINTLISLLSMTLTDVHPEGFDEAIKYCLNKAKQLNIANEVFEHLQNTLVAISSTKYEQDIFNNIELH